MTFFIEKYFEILHTISTIVLCHISKFTNVPLLTLNVRVSHYLVKWKFYPLWPSIIVCKKCESLSMRVDFSLGWERGPPAGWLKSFFSNTFNTFLIFYIYIFKDFHKMNFQVFLKNGLSDSSFPSEWSKTFLIFKGFFTEFK